MRVTEQSNHVRLAATRALLNSLEFTKANFDQPNERNYIMEIVCEATQSPDTQIKVNASFFSRLNFFHKLRICFSGDCLGMPSQNNVALLSAYGTLHGGSPISNHFRSNEVGQRCSCVAGEFTGNFKPI